MRPESRVPGEGQCYQVSRGVQAVYNDSQRRLESLDLKGQPVTESGGIHYLCA